MYLHFCARAKSLSTGARGHFNEQFSMERGGNGIGLELSNTASSGSD